MVAKTVYGMVDLTAGSMAGPKDDWMVENLVCVMAVRLAGETAAMMVESMAVWWVVSMERKLAEWMAASMVAQTELPWVEW